MSGNGAFGKASEVLSLDDALVAAAKWLKGTEPRQLEGGNLDGVWYTPEPKEQAYAAQVAAAYCAYVQTLIEVRP
jgi:hypothetical protein